MAYTTPRTFACILCGGSFPSRAPHSRYCPECRKSWTLRRNRETSKTQYNALANARRQCAREARRARAKSHADSILATVKDHGGDGDYEPPNDAEPTDAMPGSPAKVEALAARVLAGQELWHDEDCLSS